MHEQSNKRMAMRGAASACIWRQRRIPCLLFTIPRHLNPKVHHFSRSPLNHDSHRFKFPQIRESGFKIPIRAIQGATADPKLQKKDEEEAPKDWKIKMLYDGDCPLCMREVNMLRERNKQYDTIKFVDISSDEYSPEENQGLDYKTVMGRIHAILSDGTVVTDVEAFRRLYEQVGLGWVYAVTKYEPISTITDAVYRVWAKYRLQVTGRPPLEEILAARKKNKGEMCGDSNECKM